MLCFLQKFKLRVVFQNRNILKKIIVLPAAIIARDVCSCLYLRSRDFGSMNDSGGVYTHIHSQNTFGDLKISSRQGKFEPMRVDNSARSGGIIRISLIFYNMKVCCVFSLESPDLSDSYEYTQYTIFNIKRKITLYYAKSAAVRFFLRTHARVRDSHGKRPISVRVIDVLLNVLVLLAMSERVKSDETSHHRIRHMETGPRLKVSTERLKLREIEHATSRLVVRRFSYNTTAANL